MFSTVTNVDDVFGFDKVNERIADASKWSVLKSVISEVCTYLQSLAKSIRKYMKSYRPKEETSTIFLRRGWSTLLGMFLNMIYQDVRAHGDARQNGRTYGGPDVTSGNKLVDVNDVVEAARSTTVAARTSARVKTTKPVQVAEPSIPLRNKAIGSHDGRAKLLPSEGLLVVLGVKRHMQGASRRERVPLRGVHGEKGLVAANATRSLLERHALHVGCKLISGRRNGTSNVLWLGQSDDHTLFKLENTTLGDGAEDRAYGEGIKEDA